MDRQKLKKMFNPMEWLKSLYGALGAKYPVASFIIVVILGMIVGALVFGSVWRIGAYQYEKDQLKTPKLESPTQNTTYGSQSPIMPDNSGVVNITSESGQSTSGQNKKGTEKHAQQTTKGNTP